MFSSELVLLELQQDPLGHLSLEVNRPCRPRPAFRCSLFQAVRHRLKPSGWTSIRQPFKLLQVLDVGAQRRWLSLGMAHGAEVEPDLLDLELLRKRSPLWPCKEQSTGSSAPLYS